MLSILETNEESDTDHNNTTEKVNFFEKLVNKFYDKCLIRNRKLLLCKHFFHWSKVTLLYEKCEELRRISNDRLVLLSNINQAYLRDVVCVKYHIDQLKTYFHQNNHIFTLKQDKQVNQDDQDKNINVIKQNHVHFNDIPDHSSDNIMTTEVPTQLRFNEDFYSLDHLPSADLREFINNINTNQAFTSSQMIETLVNAGLLNPMTAKQFLPYERSKWAHPLIKWKYGLKSPSSNIDNQSLITLGYPSRYHVYIHHCNECTGILAFIHAWNEETEDAMKYASRSQNYDLQLQQHKSIIKNLQTHIEKQNNEIEIITQERDQIKQSFNWIKSWEFIQQGIFISLYIIIYHYMSLYLIFIIICSYIYHYISILSSYIIISSLHVIIVSYLHIYIVINHYISLYHHYTSLSLIICHYMSFYIIIHHYLSLSHIIYH